MKKFLVLGLLSLSAQAFSQTCYVDMVIKNTNRVVRTFTAYGNDTCIEGMKECRKSIRLDYSNNPQYPNGSLDCVASGSYNPAPNPYPNPQPNPYPNPQPNPYRSVDVNSLILDLSSSTYNTEVQTKIVEALVAQTRAYSLEALVRVCSSTRTWNENASCLIDGVRRAPRDVVEESTAIYAVAQACTVTKTWNDEKACFSAAISGNRLQSLNYLAQSCANIYNAESSARCYRSVFGI